jgi:hypothetical protein
VVSSHAASEDGTHTHDGFFVRVQLGVGGISSSNDANGLKRDGKGMGPALTLAIGGAVMPDLIVYGAIVDSIAMSPSLKENGAAPGVKAGRQTSGIIGVGAAYYLQPYNAFASATVGVAGLRIVDPDGKILSEATSGVGTELLLGKEWWVSANWGVGLSAQFVFSSVKDKQDSGGRWTTFGGGLLASATYN